MVLVASTKTIRRADLQNHSNYFLHRHLRLQYRLTQYLALLFSRLNKNGRDGVERLGARPEVGQTPRSMRSADEGTGWSGVGIILTRISLPSNRHRKWEEDFRSDSGR